MPIITGGSEVGNLAFNISNLLEQFTVDIAMDTATVIERQGGVESESGKIKRRVHIYLASFGIFKHLLDTDHRFEVKNGHV